MIARVSLFLAGLVVAAGLAWLWPRIQEPPTTHEIARGLLEDGHPEDALILFKDRAWRGVAEYHAGRFDRAIGEFFPPESVLELYNMGSAFARLENWNAAISSFERVLRLDPEHADARHNLNLVSLAAELATDEAVPATEDSPLLRGEGDDQQDSGTELSDPAEHKPSRSNDSDGPGQESDADLDGTSDEPGELGDLAENRRSGTANAAGDPGEDVRGALRQGPGSGELKARESAQAAEILLREITDDPDKVLRVRLFTAHERRQAGNP
jgi:Ca-activated chloride channel family protein